MIDDSEEMSVFLVFETMNPEDEGYGVAMEDVVRGVYSSNQAARAVLNNQIDPSAWWIEEWTVDE